MRLAEFLFREISWMFPPSLLSTPMAEHSPNATRQQYSKDLKERIVYQQFTLGKDTAEIAENLNMSKCVVQRVLLLWEEIGDVVRDPRRNLKWGRASVLDMTSVEVCRGMSIGNDII